MKSIVVAVFAVVICLAFAKQPPQWPNQYYVKGVFKIPYWELVEPIEFWYDGANNREFISYYDGMDTYNWRFDTQTLYQVIPRIDNMKCFVTTQIGTGPLVTLLPDLSSWTYMGISNKHKVPCDVYENVVTNFNKTAIYKMYVDASSAKPVQLHLDGYDFVFGSHPDVYIMDFEVYSTQPINQSIFTPSSLCSSAKAEPMSQNSHMRAKALLGQFGAFNPAPVDDEFDLFVAKHKKVYSDPKEYHYRRTIFQNNLKFINDHNSKPDVTFKMAMNHLGDLTPDEVQAMLYPKVTGVDRSKVNSNAVGYHQRSKLKLPDTVNWVEQGAVTKVKDQGVCGSCWTFGTTGAIEGAYAAKYGVLISLSEQQIVDCAWGTWGTGNSGCDGGFAGPAFDWIQANGGIALEDTYKYLMMDHWCNAYDLSSGVQVTGYVNITEYSEADLQDAIATVSPVTVAIDASHPSLTFYTSGVYYEPNCGSSIDQLDHQVLAVGYGTENGQDYWLVKNSWSTNWGDMGYVKMARNRNNNCGIATQANYALVD